MSTELKDFITQCTKMSPNDRPSPDQALQVTLQIQLEFNLKQHNFLKKLCNPLDLKPLVVKAKAEADSPLADYD